MFTLRHPLKVLLILSFAGLLQAQDWAGLNHYRAANRQLLSQPKNGLRVVFMGNSITESWQKMRPGYFTDHAYVNRGISGQSSSQMLVRFRPDVLQLQADVVLILAGTNDIAGNTGPISMDDILGNIISMVELSRQHGMQVILCSVLPATAFSWVPGLEPARQIVSLNRMIQQYAAEHNLPYLDYYSALVNRQLGLQQRYTRDGVHPNRAGYQVMETLAEQMLAPRRLSGHSPEGS